MMDSQKLYENSYEIKFLYNFYLLFFLNLTIILKIKNFIYFDESNF